MRFITHRIGRQYQATADRVHAGVDAAIAIVEKSARGRVGSLEVAVTNTAGMWETVVAAHEPLFGRRKSKEWRRNEGSPFGTTTVTSVGVLVVINAQTCRGRTVEIDKTLLHEITHAVQFNRPGARDLLMRSLSNNYGLTAMTTAEAAAANRQVDTDEREAERMERHHRQLAKSLA
ncbi:hypothetical protein AB0C91_10215 [Streptomyces sp. NPDC048674]|uniref:hypothetical protein n=1 Tax=Streptomyces sp. NPDC048674 TaxID=3155491 RepID=UPI0034257DBA